MQSYRFVRSVLVVSLVCLAGTVRAGLISNGGFSSQAESDAWNRTGGVSWVETDGSPDGASVRLSGHNWLYKPGSTPSLTTGQTYELSFLAALKVDDGNPLDAVLLFSSPTAEDSLFNVTSDWKRYSLTFTATAAGPWQPSFLNGYYAEARSGGGGNAGSTFGIDSVSITAVPEPSTLVLLGAGLFGLLAYAWRKRK